MTEQQTETDMRVYHTRRIMHWLDDPFERQDNREGRLVEALVLSQMRIDAMNQVRENERARARAAYARLERALRDVAPAHPALPALRPLGPIKADG